MQLVFYMGYKHACRKQLFQFYTSRGATCNKGAIYRVVALKKGVMR